MKKTLFPLVALVAFACGAPPSTEDDTVSPEGDGDASGDGDGGDGDLVDSDVPEPEGTLPDGSPAAAALPARIRRLTNAEYDAAVADLFDTQLTPGADTFPPDTRQHGYTLNEAARVDPVLARQLDAAATAIAEEVVERLEFFAPCDDAAEGGAACAELFIEEYGSRAYRRPLADEDRAGLNDLFESGSSEGSYAEGISLVVRGLLQSPGFLYLTEIGDDAESPVVRVTDHELAASLSFLLTGSPPDDELRAAVDAGELESREQRMAQAARLLAQDTGRSRIVRVVSEWLGVDRIEATAKDTNVYPEYNGLKKAMTNETRDFVLESLDSSDGSIEELLGAPWTVASSELATLYGATGQGKVDVPERPGLLNRGAFLSVYAHAHETAPVLRGTAVLRRVGCVDMELPTDLALEIVPPVPDPTMTTRERFSVHAADGMCANCHNKIDPLGFSFEHFDGMGNARTTENGKPIDSTGDVALSRDFDGMYADSAELAQALSSSEDVARCFALQIFRAGAGEAELLVESEAAFIGAWENLPSEEQRNLVSLLTAVAGSDIMAYRRNQ